MKKFTSLLVLCFLAFSAMAQITQPDYGTEGYWDGSKAYSNTTAGDNIRRTVDKVYTNLSKLPVYKLNALGSPLLAVNYDPTLVNDSVALVDNQLLLVSMVIDKKTTLTGVKALLRWRGIALESTTVNRIGLYLVSDDTTATLVASTANDTALFGGTSGSVLSKAFSTAYLADVGLYYVGILYNSVSATRAPQLYLDPLEGTFLSDLDFGVNKNRIAATIATQNDLPASFNTKAATTVVSLNRAWVGLY